MGMASDHTTEIQDPEDAEPSTTAPSSALIAVSSRIGA